jgi:saccharopine dehydrogenase (NAD+, L-lysine-forming)
LLDLEFLVNGTKMISPEPRDGVSDHIVDQGRRVAAFGYHAGFAGSALAIKTWAHQLEHGGDVPLPSVETFTNGRGYYENEDEMLAQLKVELQKGIKKAGKAPTVLVMGALGRCGKGAVDLFIKAGLPEANIQKWDLAETSAKQGPYLEIVNSDIFVNCVGRLCDRDEWQLTGADIPL